MSAIDAEILIVVAYSLFLLLAAACLEGVARHTHRRSERWHVAGFRYDVSADLWTCPNNETPLIAPHEVCPITRTTFAPATLQANSMLPRMSSFEILPATRELKMSPMPRSMISSAGARESMQLRMT